MHKDGTVPRPELVASAGTREGALAALEAGADALCLCVSAGSAEAPGALGAGEVASVVSLARARGRRVYASLDTSLKEPEVARAAEVVWDLACAGVDAMVLHDLGLWHVCRAAFPESPLHASRRLAAHNSAALRQLERMGFARACTAPEVTVPELAEIGRKTRLPLQVLAQGPLCYALPGLCLASTLLGGGGEHRGRCSEPCRWASRSRLDPSGRELHPFSASDVSLIARVWDLARAGVAALEVDGAAGSPAALHAVVRAYRKVLDAPAADRDGALGAAREILRSAGGRRASEGYAFHPHPKDVLEGGPDAAGGDVVAEVVRWKDGRVSVAPKKRLAAGDRLRFSGLPGSGDRRTLTLGAYQAEKLGKRTVLTFECPFDVRAGEAVRRAADAAGEAMERRLEAQVRTLPTGPGLPLRLKVSLAGGVLRVAAACGMVERSFEFPVSVHEAREHPLDRGVLEHHLGRLGETGYRLEGLEVEGDLPPVVVPPSELKHAAREVAAGVDVARRVGRAKRLMAVAELRAAEPAGRAEERRLWVRSESVHTLHAAGVRGAHRLVVPVTRGSLKARARIAEEAGGREKVVWELPAWIPEADLGGWRHDLEALAREGFRGLAVSNLAQLALAEGLPFEVHAGRELHALNGWAAAALLALGCRSFTPAVETDRVNLRAVAANGWPLTPVVLAYGQLPLFATRLDPDAAKGVPQGGPVETSGPMRLTWAPAPSARSREWFFVHGGPPLSWTHRLDELGALGVEEYLFDFGGRRYSDGEALSILEKAETGAGVSHSTEANFERGLE